MRLLLALWLAVFALQSADVLALVAPDGCFEVTEHGDGGDECPEGGCARCLCSARVPAPIVGVASGALEPPSAMTSPAFLAPATSTLPPRIFHVPKAI